MAPCPNCRRPAPPREDNTFFPFCSERCKAIDLGRWFGGGYRVPAEPVDPAEIPIGAGDEDQEAPAPAPPPPRRRRQ